MMIRELQRVVAKKLGIKFNRWFRESALYAAKLDQKALAVLRQRQLVYEQDGATW
jgi:arginyl-tRNA synthetase